MYPIFVALVADAAASADDHGAVDDILVEIVSWLRRIFPEVSTVPNVDQSNTDTLFTTGSLR